MGQKIEHSGVVTKIENGKIQVQIVQLSACSSCHAKGACSAADMDEKFVDVDQTDDTIKVGDFVMIYGESSHGLLAVLLAFVIPFILILVSLFILKNFTKSESLSGIIALSVLVPYYIILSFFNNKLKNKFRFTIEKINDI